MRTSTVLSTMLVIALLLFMGGWFHTQSKLSDTVPPLPSNKLPATSAPANLKVVADASPETVAPISSVTPEQHQESVENQIAELESLSRNDDSASLDRILLSLNDPDPEIRATAVDAAIQFGSADAIPALQAANAKTEIPLEKVKLQAAIEFLALPPLAVNTVTNQP